MARSLGFPGIQQRNVNDDPHAITSREEKPDSMCEIKFSLFIITLTEASVARADVETTTTIQPDVTAPFSPKSIEAICESKKCLDKEVITCSSNGACSSDYVPGGYELNVTKVLCNAEKGSKHYGTCEVHYLLIGEDPQDGGSSFRTIAIITLAVSMIGSGGWAAIRSMRSPDGKTEVSEPAWSISRTDQSLSEDSEIAAESEQVQSDAVDSNDGLQHSVDKLLTAPVTETPESRPFTSSVVES